MFAAQAGAKHVYGVDCSSIVEQARQIINLNGFSDRITLIKGKVSCSVVPLEVQHCTLLFLLLERNFLTTWC